VAHTTHDFLVVGLGIAGTLLSWRLRQAGQSVICVEPDDPNAATQVAPGIVNPLAGKRLQPSWEVAQQLPCALETYRALEAELGGSYFTEKPILRIIKDEAQAEYFEKRRNSPAAQPYIGEHHAPGLAPGLLEDPYGSFEARGSGYLDGHGLTTDFRAELDREGLRIQESFKHEELHLKDGVAHWRDDSFRNVVFCEGWRGRDNPWFSHLPFNPAKGETLELKGNVQGLPDCIINRSKWLLPRGDGHFWAGATYAWKPIDTVPTPEGRDQILQLLSEYLHAGEFDVVGQKAGVRPILRDYRPAMGRHPEHPCLAIFNGLGSKGVLAGPWLSMLLSDHLINDSELPKEVRVARFFKK